VLSASALKANCGYPRALDLVTPRSAKLQAAADLGTNFHLAVETWAKKGDLWHGVQVCATEEVRGWLELLATTWAPTGECEVALGLGSGGEYVPVNEPQPHVYVPVEAGTSLVTAGRADHVVMAGPIVVVEDFKTGKWPAPDVAVNLQLTALALAAASKHQAIGFVRRILYVRDGHVDADQQPVMLDSDEGAAAWEMVLRAAQLDDSPRPGAHCGPCWERRTKRCTFAQQSEA
jgi:hypothetical protein